MSYVKRLKKLGKDICPEGSVIRGRTARTAIKSINENDCGGSGGGKDMLQARVDATNSCRSLFSGYAGDNVDYIVNLDTSKVTDMVYMFQQCQKLTTIPQLDTSNVTDMSFMFYYCKNLTTIPQLNTSNVTTMTLMFDGCTSLKSVLMYGMKVDFSISASTQFEVSDLVTILSNCQVMTSSRTLTMKSTNLAKLENVYVKPTGVELYEGITCNPCVICESTDEGAMLATDYFTAKGWTLA